MTIELKGNWKRGFAYNLHTLSSDYLGVNEYGHDHFDTTRSNMGKLLYQLKYRNDKSAIGKIVDLLWKCHELETMFETVDAIIPMPLTRNPESFNR